MNPKMMRQVQQMQEQMLKAQEELAEQKVEVTVGGGAVRIVMNGQQEVEELIVEPEVVDPEDVEMLQDLLIAAFNEALSQSRDLVQDSMGQMLGGLGLGSLLSGF
jgi:DNA-binding YbaB/EbfC family protein